MNKLKDMFGPKGQLEELELYLRAHKETIGQCCTCIHHDAINKPGFVTDYGFCKLRLPWSDARIVAQNPEPCPQYEEASTEELEREIKRLRREVEDIKWNSHMSVPQ